MTETVKTNLTSEEKEEASAARSSPRHTKGEPLDQPEADGAGTPRDDAVDTAEKDPIVRVSKDSSLRKLIGFCIKKIEAKETVTIQALNLCVHKAVTVASIVRDRVGNVYQLNSLLVLENSRLPGKSTSGIQIVLSLSELDSADVGFQKPKPQGFAASRLTQRRRRRTASRAPDDKSTSKQAPSKTRSGDKSKDDKASEAGEKRRRQRRPRSEKKSDSVTPTVQSKKKDADEKAPAPTQTDRSEKKRVRRPRRKMDETKDDAKPAEQDRETRSQSGKNRNSENDAGHQTQKRTQGRPQQRSGPPADVDYLGREVPRHANGPREAPSSIGTGNRGYRGGRGQRSDFQDRGQRTEFQGRGQRTEIQGRGQRADFQGRGQRAEFQDRTPYYSGNSYRYMPNYRGGEDNKFFSQYDRNEDRRNPRGGRDFNDQQPRPGYYPAARRPVRPQTGAPLSTFDFPPQRRYMGNQNYNSSSLHD